MGIFFSVLICLLVISVLIAVHELGHLLIARMNGVFVDAFSIGCGPVLFSVSDKYGTKWRFSLLPIGGYVKMLGDADATSLRSADLKKMDLSEEVKQKSITNKKPWQKLLIAAGGPLANLFFAIFVLTATSVISGIPTYQNTINTISETSLAYTSGIRNGDKVVAINNKIITSFIQIKKAIDSSNGNDLNMKLERGKQLVFVNIKMKAKDGKVVQKLGIIPTSMMYQKTNLIEAVATACSTVCIIAYQNVVGIFQAVIVKKNTDDVGGVIAVFNMITKSVDGGFSSLIWMIIVLSTVLGSINLLPIPVLDGGTIVISAIEWCIGKPLNEKFINIIFFIGLAIVAFLMVLGLWNDLNKFNILELITKK